MARLKSDKHAVEPSSEVESYYTTLEVARMLGMAVRSVQLMVDRGDLQAWKTPGGHRRITGSSLQRWLAKSRAGLTPPAATRAVRPRRRVGSGSSARSPRVLLIEDSAHFQQLVRLLFRQRLPDVELHIASDGITGLVSFGQLQPDVIIVDILLPGIDGASMVMGLREHELFGGCGLVVLTALDEADRGEYAYALEGVPVVHKPHLVRELPPLIERILSQRYPDAVDKSSAISDSSELRVARDGINQAAPTNHLVSAKAVPQS
jgi:excisionase family DNA binding protein